MVTKGIIKSIDYSGNTCTVHIPLFETAGNDPIIETATVSNTPGSYNGYKVGDVVYVAFEDGSMSNPVIIGKLYLGSEKEKADPRGVSNVEESSAAKKAALPADSTLTTDISSKTPNTMAPYNSLSSIANSLNTLNTEVGQMDRDFGNRLVQIFSNAEGMESRFKQAADYMQGNVVKKFDTGTKESIPVLGDDGKPVASGLTTKGLGWHLDNDQWIIKAYDQNTAGTLPKDGLDLFKVDRTSVEINAPSVKLAGYPRTTTIRYAYSNSTTTYPALYTKDTQSLKDEDINLVVTGENGWTSRQLDWQDGKYIWQWTQTAKYEYSEDNNTWVDTITDKVICLAGSSAASYYITATPAQVTYNPNTKKYTPESKKVAISFYRKVGTGNPELLTDSTFSYSVDAGDLTALSDQGEHNIEVATTTTIKLYNSADKELASITIPVVPEGNDATAYWLNCSTPVHTGHNQTLGITITAMSKTGLLAEKPDLTAKLYYQYEGGSSWTPTSPESASNSITIPASNVQDKNLIVKAEHGGVEYDRETITYSPLNTPVLDLSNDNASIAYSGDTKLGSDVSVSSTANLYLNGEALDAEVLWFLENCAGSTGETKWLSEDGGYEADGGYEKAVPCGSIVTVSDLAATNTKATCIAFKKHHEPKLIIYRSLDLAISQERTEAAWAATKALEKDAWGVTASTANSLAAGDYFVVLGKSSENKNHVIWYEFTQTAVDERTDEVTGVWGKTLETDTFYEKDFTISKQLKGEIGSQGVSIVSQTTYYALIKPSFTAGYLIRPKNDTDLEIKAYNNEEEKANGQSESPYNLIEGDESVKNNWELQPPAHNATTIEDGWKYWTTVRTETNATTNKVSFSLPIINEEVSGAYALAQGKTTNYYQTNDPTTPEGGSHTVKKGDCWFDTGTRYVQVTSTSDPAVNNDGTFNTKEQYLNYFIAADGGGYTEITASTLNLVEPNVSVAFKQDKNCLKQWTGSEWKDIGGELVTNKLTANYINALDITAKKVTVIDSKNSGILFDANGLGYDASGKAVDTYVKIAGFTVESNTLTTGEKENGNLIKINSDNTNNCKILELTTAEKNKSNWATGVNVASFKKHDTLTNLLVQESTTPDLLTYYATNSAGGNNFAYVAAKVVFTQDIKDFTLYLQAPLTASGDVILASTLFEGAYTGDIPTALGQANIAGYAEGNAAGTNALQAVTYPKITAGQFIYIVYRHFSSNHNTTNRAYFYLPASIRFSVGENFQVLADGTVYAKNLFLNTTTASAFGSDTDYGDDAAGKLAALSAEINTVRADLVQAKKVEVKDSSDSTIFKADGRETDEDGSVISDEDRVQVGGFNVTADKLTAGSGNGYIRLQTTQDPLEYTPAEYIEFSGTQYIDTGVVMDYDTDVVEITVQPTVAEQDGMFFGVWDAENSVGENTAVFYHYGRSGGTKTIMFYVGGGKIQNLSSGISTTNLTKHTYRFEKKTNYELSVDGITKATTEANWTIDPESSHTSCIGAAYRPSGVAGWYYSGKIYSCKIWRNGKLHRDFIPVWKDGYGLYDNCFGKFYPNNGTGKIGGALDHSLDSTFTLNGIKYTRLDYIQNNGKDNYIDTGLTLNFGTGFTVEAEIMTTAPLAPNDRCCILSSYASDVGGSNNNFSFELYELSGKDQVRAYIDHGHPDYQFGEIKENTKYNIKYSVTSSNVKITLDGGTSGEKSFDYTLTDNINASPYIFVDRIKRFDVFDIPLRLYSMKIYSGGSLIAHYVPVLNNVHTPGLVNLITGQFLTTPSGSPFTYDAYSPKGGHILVNDENSYRTLSYIESDSNSVGTAAGAYIDTGVYAHSGITIEVDAMALEKFSYYGNLGGYNATIGGTGDRDGKSYFYCGDETSNPRGISVQPVIGVREVLKQSDKKCYRNGIEVAEFDNSISSTCAHSMVLFARRGLNGGIEDRGKIRIYSCRIWENNNLIRDFIPVIKNETEYGLYDLRDNAFYGNSNTKGTFTGKGYASEFTALYLGATEPDIAPFSVTNTGKLKAESGTIGGFELSESTIKSKNENLQLNSAGNIIVKAGEIGGWQIDKTETAEPIIFRRSYKTDQNGILKGNQTVGMAALDDQNSDNKNIDVVFWAGCEEGKTPWEWGENFSNKSPFYVTSRGFLRSSSGKIGCLNVTEDKLELHTTPTDGTASTILYELGPTGITFNSGGQLALGSLIFQTDDNETITYANKKYVIKNVDITDTGQPTTISSITLGGEQESSSAILNFKLQLQITGGNSHGSPKCTVTAKAVDNSGKAVRVKQAITVNYLLRIVEWDMSFDQIDTATKYSITINKNASSATRSHSPGWALFDQYAQICHVENQSSWHTGKTGSGEKPRNNVVNLSHSASAVVYEKNIQQGSTSNVIEFVGNLTPETAGTYDIGASDRHWKAGWFNSLTTESLTHGAHDCTSSDKKVKNTIEYDISKYDKVFDTLKPVSYKYNNGTSDRTHLGFIAQDVQASIVQAELTDKDCAIVVIDGEGFDKTLGKVIDEEKTSYYVRYGELHALEVRQIQLLKQEIKELKAEIEELKSKQT